MQHSEGIYCSRTITSELIEKLKTYQLIIKVTLLRTETQRSRPQSADSDRQRDPARGLEGIRQQVRKHSDQRVLRSDRGELCHDKLQQQSRRCWKRHLPPQGTRPPPTPGDPHYEVNTVVSSLWFLIFVTSEILQWYFPYSLVKYDVDAGEPVRDSSGFCIEVAKGESRTSASRPCPHVCGCF